MDHAKKSEEKQSYERIATEAGSIAVEIMLRETERAELMKRKDEEIETLATSRKAEIQAVCVELKKVETSPETKKELLDNILGDRSQSDATEFLTHVLRQSGHVEGTVDDVLQARLIDFVEFIGGHVQGISPLYRPMELLQVEPCFNQLHYEAGIDSLDAFLNFNEESLITFMKRLKDTIRIGHYYTQKLQLSLKEIMLATMEGFEKLITTWRGWESRVTKDLRGRICPLYNSVVTAEILCQLIDPQKLTLLEKARVIEERYKENVKDIKQRYKDEEIRLKEEVKKLQDINLAGGGPVDPEEDDLTGFRGDDLSDDESVDFGAGLPDEVLRIMQQHASSKQLAVNSKVHTVWWKVARTLPRYYIDTRSNKQVEEELGVLRVDQETIDISRERMGLMIELNGIKTPKGTKQEVLRDVLQRVGDGTVFKEWPKVSEGILNLNVPIKTMLEHFMKDPEVEDGVLGALVLLALPPVSRTTHTPESILDAVTVILNKSGISTVDDLLSLSGQKYIEFWEGPDLGDRGLEHSPERLGVSLLFIFDDNKLRNLLRAMVDPKKLEIITRASWHSEYLGEVCVSLFGPWAVPRAQIATPTPSTCLWDLGETPGRWQVYSGEPPIRFQKVMPDIGHVRIYYHGCNPGNIRWTEPPEITKGDRWEGTEGGSRPYNRLPSTLITGQWLKRWRVANISDVRAWRQLSNFKGGGRRKNKTKENKTKKNKTRKNKTKKNKTRKNKDKNHKKKSRRSRRSRRSRKSRS